MLFACDIACELILEATGTSHGQVGSWPAASSNSIVVFLTRVESWPIWLYYLAVSRMFTPVYYIDEYVDQATAYLMSRWVPGRNHGPHTSHDLIRGVILDITLEHNPVILIVSAWHFTVTQAFYRNVDICRQAVVIHCFLLGI